VIDATLAHRIFDWGGWNALVALGTLALAAAAYGVIRATSSWPNAETLSSRLSDGPSCLCVIECQSS